MRKLFATLPLTILLVFGNTAARSQPFLAAEADPAAARQQALMEAALEGQLDTVKQLLVLGAEAGRPDAQGRTPLMMASFNGHEKVIRHLLEKGAAIDARDSENRTALMFASTGPFPAVVELLLDNGARVNAVDNNEHWSPLMFSAGEGHTPVVKVLLAHGANPLLEDIDGETALDFARSKNHAETVAFLEAALKEAGKKTP